MFFRSASGIHPEYFKELTQDKPVKLAEPPKVAVIPLIQHKGAPCQPLVKAQDKVRIGTKIGDSGKFISSPVHSSVSGTVNYIDKSPHPLLGQSMSVYIENDGLDEIDPAYFTLRNADKLATEQICAIVKDAGIVGMGGSAFPTHVKLSQHKEKKIDTLIINGVECEPYLTCDYRLMIENTKQILKGTRIIKKVLGAGNVIIAIEENKPKAIEAIKKFLQSADFSDLKDAKIKTLEAVYPEGAEKTMIKNILNREVPSGGLPLDIGAMVQNVGTAAAVFEAVELGKPLYERVVTVSGSCVKEPANLKARIGTPIKELIKQCGGLVGEPAKIIIGGPMMGITQYTDDVPVIKGTTGILVLSKKEVLENDKWSACISCARCVEACPVWLVPSILSMAAEKNKFGVAQEYDVCDCIECGICGYVCPSKRPMVQLIKYAKENILKKQKEKTVI